LSERRNSKPQTPNTKETPNSKSQKKAPRGVVENSPAIHRWVRCPDQIQQVPSGTTEIARQNVECKDDPGDPCYCACRNLASIVRKVL
jgi:hypothetical protein